MGTHPIFESDFDCLTEMDKLKSTLSKLGESDLAFIISEMERKIERNSETNCDSDDSESYFHEEFQEIEQQWNYPIKLRRMYRKIYNEEIRLEFQKKPKNIPLVGTDSMNLSVHLMDDKISIDTTFLLNEGNRIQIGLQFISYINKKENLTIFFDSDGCNQRTLHINEKIESNFINYERRPNHRNNNYKIGPSVMITRIYVFIVKMGKSRPSSTQFQKRMNEIGSRQATLVTSILTKT